MVVVSHDLPFSVCALLENSNVLGAIIFKNSETQDKQLPDILAYKIRQNASFTHNTA
jgi:hypothetical protein